LRNLMRAWTNGGGVRASTTMLPLKSGSKRS
jgi:hypothetical protein